MDQFDVSPSEGSKVGKVLMGSISECGQINPLLAIAERLIARGHEIHFASGQSGRKRIDEFNAQLSNFEDTAGKLVVYHDLGPEVCVNDHNYMASASPEEFAMYKKIIAQGPRNVTVFNEFVYLFMRGSLEGRKEAMDRFIDLMKEIKPDILVLDQFTSPLVEAARVTGADYIVTAPASPSTLSSPTLFSEPMSGTNLERPMSLKATLLNVWYCANLVPRVIVHPALKALRDYRLNVLKLPSINKIIDGDPFSKFHPSWTNQKAIISPNVDFRQQTPFEKVIFVGTCMQRRVPMSIEKTNADLSILEWLDEAEKNGDHVVYLNFGTIFRYIQSEIDELFTAVRLLNQRRPGSRGVLFLWKLPRGKFDLSAVPPQVKFFEWIQDPLVVYEHSAVKACVNHGGGNSFNEALQYGIPQLVCSQWFDTIDYAVAARTSGIGLSSENPGRISGHDVSDKVSRLLTEKSFMDKTRLWSLKSRAAGGSRAAADVVEAHLNNNWGRRSAHLTNYPDVSVAASVQKPKVYRYLLVLLAAVLLSVPVMNLIGRFFSRLGLLLPV